MQGKPEPQNPAFDSSRGNKKALSSGHSKGPYFRRKPGSVEEEKKQESGVSGTRGKSLGGTSGKEKDVQEMKRKNEAVLKTTRSQHDQITRLSANIKRLKDENRALKQRLSEYRHRDAPIDEDLVYAMQLQGMESASYPEMDNDEGLDPDIQLALALEQSGKRYIEAASRDSMTYEEMLAISESLGTVPTGLSQEQFSALPRVKYRMRDSKICTICMVEFQLREELVSLPRCGHLYHIPCINTWFQSKKTCPMCLSEVI